LTAEAILETTFTHPPQICSFCQFQ
jgi:hypothetical protein